MTNASSATANGASARGDAAELYGVICAGTSPTEVTASGPPAISSSVPSATSVTAAGSTPSATGAVPSGVVAVGPAAVAVEPAPATLVEHNGLALRREEWPSRLLAEGDIVELVRIVAGG